MWTCIQLQYEVYKLRNTTEMMETIIHFVGEIECDCHEHILHEVVWCVADVGGLMPANICIASYHRLAVCRTKL